MRRWKRWAGSRRGVCSIAVAVTALVYAVSQGKVQLVQVPLAGLVVLGVAAAVVFVLAAMWEDKLHPATPRFARAQPPTSTRQFREDANARVFTNHTGFLFGQRGFFVGTGCPPVLLPLAFLAQARAAQQAAPVLVASTPTRRFWWYRDGFCWENQDLEPRDVMALWHAKDRRHSRQMQTARVLLDVEQGRVAPAPRQRQPIPREVQREVRGVPVGLPDPVRPRHPVLPWRRGQRGEPAAAVRGLQPAQGRLVLTVPNGLQPPTASGQYEKQSPFTR